MSRHDGSPPTLLIALGGNALLPRGERPDAATQQARIAAVAPALAAAARGHRLILTHGNGPQVGLLAVESADDASLTRPYPLDALGAESQGLIGYWLQRALHPHLAGARHAGVVTVVTQTVVDPADPAFARPTKFVGASSSEGAAREVAAERGWTVAPDGTGWRRVVPSPAPRRVVELPIIEALVERGVTVVCAGGGGVPVIAEGDQLVGVEAVVDKDAVAAWLAAALDVERLVLLTDVAAVMDDWGGPAPQPIAHATVEELEARRFDDGSMGPKVAAACACVRATGRPAVVGALDDVEAVLADRAGTRVRLR